MDCTLWGCWSIEALPETLPGKVVWVDLQRSSLFCKIQFLHAVEQQLNPRCLKRTWTRLLINAFKTRGIPDHLKMKTRDTPSHWRGYLATTIGFLTFMVYRTSQAHHEPTREAFAGYIRKICALAMETIPLGRLEMVPLERVQLSVGRDGCMHGFSGWLASLQPCRDHLSAVLEALRADWIYLKETGLLARDFDVGEYHLSDVCVCS